MSEKTENAKLKKRLEREKSARKQAEKLLEEKSLALFHSNQELKNIAQHLESLVDKRTQALQKSMQEALQLATAKSQFLANVSHEFKTPLNGILGSLSLLKQTSLSKAQIQMADTAESCGESLVQLINNVLEVSQLASDKVSLLNVPFDATELANQVVQAFQPELKRKGLTLSIQTQHLPALLKGDPQRIKQLLTHLISNAIKFSDKGEIQVTLGYGSSGFCLVVTDQGIGISEQLQAEIFNIFTQADESMTRLHGGVGLGLTLCQKICHLFGGNIELSSTLNQGTKVCVTLPLARELQENVVTKTVLPQSKLSTPNSNQNSQKASQIRFHNQSILLVEDNAINQQVIADLLRAMNLSVTIAENGKEGVEKFHQATIQLILMDIQMPVMDGLEAIKTIRQSGQKNATLPILALTAHSLPEDRKRSFDAGADEHLTKPIDYSTLAEAIAAYLPHDRTEAEGEGDAASHDTSNTQTISLYGIDYPTVAERLMYNDELITKVFNLFIQQYQGFATSLEKAITESDHELAQRALHTLKGSAGNISAINVASYSAKLEKSLKDKPLTVEWQTQNSNELKTLFEELEKVLAGLREKYHPNQAQIQKQKSTTVFDSQKAQACINAIAQNIYVDLSEVETGLTQLQNMPTHPELNSHIRALHNGLQNFNYDEMEQSCSEMLAIIQEAIK